MNAQQHQPLSILNAKRIGIGRDFQPNPECMNKKASAFRRVVLGAMAVLGLSIHVFAISRPVPRGTFPNAINKRGEVAGTCIDSIAVAHGFVRDARGGITVFDAPGAGQRQRQGTFATDINNDGTIVGYYIDEKLLHHGFVRDPDGTLTTLDAPGAGEGLRPPVMAHPELRSGQGTVASRVNDRGNIIGYFIDAKNVEHGFLRDKLGTFLAFDVPGSGGTVPESLNDSGEITGTYNDPPNVVNNSRVHSYSSGAEHGFLRDANGTITVCDLPLAGNTPWEGAHPQTVTNDGAVVGWYGRNRDVFIRDAHGAYATFSIPEIHLQPSGAIGEEEITACYLGAQGATQVPARDAHGASDAFNSASLRPGRFQGVICAALTAGDAAVGYYPGNDSKLHGFIRPGHGALATFDAPCEGNAVVITSVSPLVAGATEAVTITGRHFGNYESPTVRNEGRIVIEDSGPGRGCGAIPTAGDGAEGPLRVARWTDVEIVVTGFHWPSMGPCPYHAGDQVGFDVWNAQTGAGPASYGLTVGSTSKDLTPPHIASVTPVYPRADQTFIIKGEGFGTQPTDQDSDYLDIWNDTARWIARRATDTQGELAASKLGDFQPITLRVGRWTPHEIEVTGLGGAYGQGHWTLNGGDRIKIDVWNPQTGAGPATYELTVVGAGQDLAAARITSAGEIGEAPRAQPLTAAAALPTQPAALADAPSADDEAITSRIEAKLFADLLLKTRDIRVRTQGGVVTLSGTVNTELEKAAVDRIARKQRGVKRLIDTLAIPNQVSAPSAASVRASEPTFRGGAAEVTAEAQCTSADFSRPMAWAHGIGTIRILSGGGSFAGISGENKTVNVNPGAALQGTITLRVLNLGPGFAVAPLIETPSWGRHQDSWKMISHLRPGDSSWNAQINERAPVESGVYYIVFAFFLETNGASVASGTNWAAGRPVWDDGNDLAQFHSSQIHQAQQFGCAVNRWIMEDGSRLVYVPADAITVRVGTSPAIQHQLDPGVPGGVLADQGETGGPFPPSRLRCCSFRPGHPKPMLPPVKLTLLQPPSPAELPDRNTAARRLAQLLLPISCFLCIRISTAHPTPPLPMRDRICALCVYLWGSIGPEIKPEKMGSPDAYRLPRVNHLGVSAISIAEMICLAFSKRQGPARR